MPIDTPTISILVAEVAGTMTSALAVLQLDILLHDKGRISTQLTLNFEDGAGGGGGNARMFLPPMVEFVYDNDGYPWVFGIVPKTCVSVTIGPDQAVLIPRPDFNIGFFCSQTTDLPDAVVIQLPGRAVAVQLVK